MTKKALVLNAGYEPLSVVSWKRGFVLSNFSIDGDPSARTERNYEERIAVGDGRIFYKPAVVVLRKQIPVRPRKVKLTHSAVFRRDNYTCQYCRVRCATDIISVDHVIPKFQGGKNTWRNLVTACKSCNNKKGHRTLDVCEMKLARLPFAPVWPNDPSIPEEWEGHLF